MAIEEVTMYRVVCDAPGCGLSAQENGEFHAWADAGSAIDEAVDRDWDTQGEQDFCREHARPRCDSCTDHHEAPDLTAVNDGERWCGECIREAEPAEPAAAV